MTLDLGASEEKRARLRRMKTIATAVLVVMAIVFAVSARFRAQYPVLAWIQAFSEAALIGGLADWFAVVALFRYPGGVRFPHTAIVPNNKDRIGTQLGIFVEQNFLTPSNIAARLRDIDVAGALLRWLAVAANVRTLFATARDVAPRVLDAVDDDEIRAVIKRVAADEIARLDLARTGAEVLAIVTRDGVHQRILEGVLPSVAAWLSGQRAEIKRRFAKRSLLTPGWLDAYIVNQFVDGMIDLIGEIARTPEHPMRREFDVSLRKLAERLRDDPRLEARAERLKREIAEGPELDGFVNAAWSALRARLERPPLDPAGPARFSAIAANVAQGLLEQPAIVARLNLKIGAAAEAVLPRFQRQFATLITDVVQRWDADLITDKIETELGPDLQFIRLNGSLVGGIAGLALQALLTAAHVA